MRNTIRLYKVQMMSMLGINKIRYSKDKNRNLKLLGLYVGFPLIFLLFCFLSFLYSALMVMQFSSLGMAHLALAAMLAVSSIITLFTCIYKSNGLLYGFQDYDMVMSLPVSTFQVVASRLLLMYTMNLTFTLVIMLPASAAYAIWGGATGLFYVYSLIGILFVPLVPIVVASIIGFFISWVASHFRHANFMKIIVTFVAFFGFMAVYMAFVSMAPGMEEAQITDIAATFMNQLNQIYPMTRFYTDAACFGNPLAMLLFVGISVLLFVVFAAIISLNYKRLNTRLSTTRTRSNYKMRALKTSSPLWALTKKEFMRYTRSSIYIFNTAAGILMVTIACVALLVWNPPELQQFLAIPELKSYIVPLAPFVVSFMAVTCYISACSISMEGKQLWVLRQLPVSPQQVLRAKILINLLVLIPLVVVDAVILSLMLKLDVIGILLMVLNPIAYSIFIAVMGLYVNLKMPNLTWTSEAVVVKRSAASMVASFVGLFGAALPAIGVFFAGEYMLIASAGVTVLVFLLDILLYTLLMTNGAKTFATLAE